MSIEQKPEVVTEETNNEVESTEVDETTDETTSQEETKASKPKRTPEEELNYYEGRASRLRKKLGKDAPEKESKSSNSNDLGERAFLAVNGIKTPDEIAFFKKIKAETGKSADALLESTYFQAEFSNFKELKATSAATPSGSKRSANSSVDTVEYWIAKGELPPASEVKLRQDVVNARMKKEESKGIFYNS
jgi:hypothetical protein